MDNLPSTEAIIGWLETNASSDDVIPGVEWMGNCRGTNNSDWHVSDRQDFYWWWISNF